MLKECVMENGNILFIADGKSCQQKHSKIGKPLNMHFTGDWRQIQKMF